MASTISVDFQNMLAKLYQKLTSNLADYDFEEQAKRRLYDQNLHSSTLGRESSMVNSSVNMADRGLNRSGIALKDHVDVNSAYDSKNASHASGLSTDLSSLARKRLEAEAAYNLDKAELERQTALGAVVSGAVGGGRFGGGGGGNSGASPLPLTGGAAPSTPSPYSDYPNGVPAKLPVYRGGTPSNSNVPFGPPKKKNASGNSGGLPFKYV